MPRLLTILCLFLPLAALTQTRLSGYLMAQYDHTLYDYTKGNNPWGIGLGFQSFVNNKGNFKPVVELSAAAYLEDDKVLKLNPDGSIPQNDNSVRSTVHLFGGLMYQPAKPVYMMLTAGPGFVSGQTLLGIRPSVGLYFSGTQKWTGKLYFTQVFNRMYEENFGSFGLSVGMRLF